jgi:hypothetical protein
MKLSNAQEDTHEVYSTPAEANGDNTVAKLAIQLSYR